MAAIGCLSALLWCSRPRLPCVILAVEMPIIALDALGGSNAPKATVEAAAAVSRSTTIETVLVGDVKTIHPVLSHFVGGTGGVHCNSVERKS